MKTVAPKTSKCRECGNYVEEECARRKKGRSHMHPGKPRRCRWFSAKS